MESKGNYFYVKKTELKKNFTQIPNNIFALKLSATEKLILIYLFSNSEEFRITNYRIKESLGSDYRTVKKALDKFQMSGIISYVNCSTIQINTGVFDSVQFTTSKPTTSKPTTSKSTTSKPTTSNSTTSQVTTIDSSNSTTIDSSNSTTNSSNSTSKIVVELHNNNTKEQDQEKKNSQEELTKRSADLDLGGGVQHTLAPPLGGSLAPASHTPTIEDVVITTKPNPSNEVTEVGITDVHTPSRDLSDSDANIKRQLSDNETDKLFKPNNQAVAGIGGNTTTRQYQKLTNQRYIDEVKSYTNSTYIKDITVVVKGYEDLGKLNADNRKFIGIREYEKIMYWQCFQRSPATNLFNEGVEVNKIVNKEMTYHRDVIEEVNGRLDILIADINADPDTYKWLLTKTL